MTEPRPFTSPAGSAAGLFREVLPSHLPVGWMSSNLYMMELLQRLGMELAMSLPLILLCSQDLDDSLGHLVCGVGQSSGEASEEEELRLKSFKLVEERARAAEEVWPKPKPGEALSVSASKPPGDANGDGMTALLKAASLYIFMARRYSNTATKRREARERNSKRQKSQIKHAEAESVPLKGVAFKTARRVLWTSCPSATRGWQTSRPSRQTTATGSSTVRTGSTSPRTRRKSWSEPSRCPEPGRGPAGGRPACQ